MFNQSGLLVVNLFDSRLEWEVQWRVCLNIGQLPYHILNLQPGGQSSSGTYTHNVPLTNRTAVKVSDTLQLQSLISNHRLISLLHRICVCKRCDQPCGALLKRKQLFDLCQMANVKAGTLWCLLHGIGFALTRRLTEGVLKKSWKWIKSNVTSSQKSVSLKMELSLWKNYTAWLLSKLHCIKRKNSFRMSKCPLWLTANQYKQGKCTPKPDIWHVNQPLRTCICFHTKLINAWLTLFPSHSSCATPAQRTSTHLSWSTSIFVIWMYRRTAKKKKRLM